MTWPSGRSRYNLAIVAELRTFRAGARSSSTWTARRWTTEAMLVAVGNGAVVRRRHAGLPGRPAGRRAARHHGARARSRKLEFLRVFPTVYKGTHVSHPAVTVTPGPQRVARGRRRRRLRRRRAVSAPSLPVHRRGGARRAARTCRRRPAGRRFGGHGTSPAQRYAAARRRQAGSTSRSSPTSAALYAFGLDPFQVRPARRSRPAAACWSPRPPAPARPSSASSPSTSPSPRAASASTRRRSRRCRTRSTPTSSRRYGADKVGLLTGDNTVNGEAPVVVMTTEVLRNMLYAGSRDPRRARLRRDGRGALPLRPLPRRGLGGGDHPPARVGARWSSLSATVSNAEEFGDWLVTVRGDTAVVVEEHRPVPLWQHVHGRRPALRPVRRRRARTVVNPELVRLARERGPLRRGSATGRGRGRGGRRPRRPRLPTPGRGRSSGWTPKALLPAITFIFSRAGCDAAVAQCLRAGLRLDHAGRARARSATLVEERCAEHPRRGPRACSATTSGSTGWSAASPPTTPGMLPTFKEVVEELFVRGPGQGGLRHRDAGARHQHAGPLGGARAAGQVERRDARRRHAGGVHPADRPRRAARHRRRGPRRRGVARRASTRGRSPGWRRPAPIRCARRFRPSYNMAVNLVGQVGRDAARASCSRRRSRSSRPTGPSSGWPGRCASNEEALEGYREAMTCHLGDFEEYAALRRALADREAELAAQRRGHSAGPRPRPSLEKLRPGDVIRVPGRPPRRARRRARPGRRAGGLDGPRPDRADRRPAGASG